MAVENAVDEALIAFQQVDKADEQDLYLALYEYWYTPGLESFTQLDDVMAVDERLNDNLSQETIGFLQAVLTTARTQVDPSTELKSFLIRLILTAHPDWATMFAPLRVEDPDRPKYFYDENSGTTGIFFVSASPAEDVQGIQLEQPAAPGAAASQATPAAPQRIPYPYAPFTSWFYDENSTRDNLYFTSADTITDPRGQPLPPLPWNLATEEQQRQVKEIYRGRTPAQDPQTAFDTAIISWDTGWAARDDNTRRQEIATFVAAQLPPAAPATSTGQTASPDGAVAVLTPQEETELVESLNTAFENVPPERFSSDGGEISQLMEDVMHDLVAQERAAQATRQTAPAT